jgi:hypothetical protein
MQCVGLHPATDKLAGCIYFWSREWDNRDRLTNRMAIGRPTEPIWPCIFLHEL